MTHYIVAPIAARVSIEVAMRLQVLTRPSFLTPKALTPNILTLSSTVASSKHAFPTRLRHRQRIPHSACRNRPGFLA
jgi:hypothetical protein